MSGSLALGGCIVFCAVAGALLGIELATRLKSASARGRARSRVRGWQRTAGAREDVHGAGDGAGDGATDADGFSSGIFGSIRLPFLGWRAKGPSRTELDTQLSEMIDVVCLAMEGGMQFDGAFSVYAEGFEGELAMACRPAARMLRTGVAEREKVLSDLADSLGSRSFRRFSDMVCRSLRYGTRLAPLLRQLSAETRRECRANREEAVAKAPIKMLIPTGVLILPAMMILIAGPFLLEIMGNM